MVISKITLERAEQWLNWDPNETTADYLRGLLNRVDEADSEESLSMLFPPNSGRIGFGTAGLRAAMDIGPLRMNDLVIVQTAQGLVKYCQAQDDKRLRIVIGYDHRSNTDLGLSSLSFAILTALVVKQSGTECILLDGFVPTPLVAFATQKLGAAAGIMVTASHNPKQDNGYKVYWSDGCQIRPPLDKEISASILENLTPWTDYRDLFAGLPRSDPSRGLSDPIMTKSLRAQYFDAIRRSGLVSGVIPVPKPTPAFCYSAMHGVGHPFAEEAFRIFGLPPFLSVPEQEQPDPMFPTVSFPNPEEKDALKLAKAFSDQHGCDVILANDPDADRLAVAERDQKTREWIIFTGDQIGALLGSWLWEIIGKTSDKVSFCNREFCLKAKFTKMSEIFNFVVGDCNVCVSCLLSSTLRNGTC
jgi:phosphoglucomutase/phosphoglucomutase/phosphopentomutase